MGSIGFFPSPHVGMDLAMTGLASGYIDITPALAEYFLLHNYNNRNLRQAHVRALAEDMRRGNFETTHQGIAFYETGVLADGQHRLEAIRESGVTVRMLVTFGMPVSAHIDMGAKRTEADAMRILNGPSDWMNQRAMSMVNALKSIFPCCGIVTLTDKRDYLLRYSTEARFALDTYKCCTRGLASTSICLVFMMACQDGVDVDVLTRAAELLSTGMPPALPDPACKTMLVLRNYLLNQPVRSGAAYQKRTAYVTANMLNRYAHGQSASRATLPVKFPFAVHDLSGGRIFI